MKKLGFIVNPLAGIGGRVALKGSDGAEIVEKALALGAERLSPRRAVIALEKLVPLKDGLELVTCPEDMGETEAVECGFAPVLVGKPHEGHTTAADTTLAAREMQERGVDMILFAGGDGTARDIYDAVGTSITVVGIPTGTKMHSGIYASSPAAAGELAAMYLTGKQARTAELEVMDIDEDAFRQGKVQAKLYGYLRVPDEPKYTQGTKGGGHTTDEAFYMRGIAKRVVDDMKPGVLYCVGSGTTCRAVMDHLELPNTLLGIDVVKDKELVASDVSEKQLLALMDEHPDSMIIVTPIGGQGYIFGRGNQQLSAAVIQKVGLDNITVIGTPGKVNSLPGLQLRVDTGDPGVDAQLCRPHRVVTGAYELAVLDIV